MSDDSDTRSEGDVDAPGAPAVRTRRPKGGRAKPGDRSAQDLGLLVLHLWDCHRGSACEPTVRELEALQRLHEARDATS